LDENINEAMRNLHTPIRRPSETREDYKAQQAASARLCKQHAAEMVEQQIQHTHVTMVDKLNQLLDEQEEHDTMCHKPRRTDKRNHPNSDGSKSDNI
jgi:hypothetical protein